MKSKRNSKYNKKNINGLFKKIFIVFLTLVKICLINEKNFPSSIKKLDSKEANNIKVSSFYELFISGINNNKTILIFEPYDCHNECTPGYSKYFIDLGYNVDLLIHKSGIDSLSLFQEIKNIRMFTFNKLSQIKMNAYYLSTIIKRYEFILLQSTDINTKDLYIDLNLLKINNSIFVFHDIRFARLTFEKYLNENRIWTLGNMTKGLQVNPHYFGNIKLRDKNFKVRFFLTSTNFRNYNDLIESVNRLKSENFDFELVITGRSKTFDSNNINKNISENFIFKHGASYSELYQLVESSDYIIIPLEANNENDNLYKNIKVTGSMQLVYGFLKPAIIHQEFADFYNLNNKNSLLYNKSTLYFTMRKAILINNTEYKKIQNNLRLIEKQIYKTSINNIKKFLSN